MDENAITLIQQTAIAANDNRQARMPVGTIALPDNFNVVDLEKFLPQRRRFRGAMETHSIADFTTYVKARAGGDGYIDGDNLKAIVFFNLGTAIEPGHGDYRAVLSLKKTAPFSAVCKVDGAKFDQRGLLDWLEDWAANLTAIKNGPEGGSEVPWSHAIQAIREVTISAKKEVESRQDDFKVGRTAMEEIEARSKLGLPSGFVFRCSPYLGLSDREFFLRLSVLTGGEKPVLVLRFVQQEAHQEAIAEEFKTLLIREIGDAAAMTIGTFTP